MTDIYLGIAIMFVLSAASFSLAYILSKEMARSTFYITALCVVGSFAVYHIHLHDRALMSRLLPFSNLIIVGNWVPLFGSFIAGLALRRIPGGKVRKIIFVAPLMAISLFTIVASLRGYTPIGGHYVRDGVSIQSALSSCGAACAATLLRNHGIHATEAEMIIACLTRERGTHWFGLYRGLKLKTEGRGFKLQLFEGDIEKLRSLRQPVILSVRLDLRPGLDPRYVEQWGWVPGVQHAVVLYGFAVDGAPIIADPAIGIEHWSLSDLALLWHGEGMLLLKH
jgi:hypothetical protein